MDADGVVCGNRCKHYTDAQLFANATRCFLNKQHIMEALEWIDAERQLLQAQLGPAVDLDWIDEVLDNDSGKLMSSALFLTPSLHPYILHPNVPDEIGRGRLVGRIKRNTNLHTPL